MSTTPEMRVPVREIAPGVDPEKLDAKAAAYEASQKAKKTESFKSNWEAIVKQRGRRYAKCQLSEFDLGDDELTTKRETAVGKVQAFGERLLAGCTTESLVLAGPSGTGKDHLMFYALRLAVRGAGLKAMWIDGQSFFGMLRDSISNRTSEAEVIQPLIRADVLAISDPVPPLGTLSDHQRNILFRVIDSRYANMLPTWATLNASSAKELDERMGVQLVDRLLHDAVAVNCYWPSYRRKPR